MSKEADPTDKKLGLMNEMMSKYSKFRMSANELSLIPYCVIGKAEIPENENQEIRPKIACVLHSSIVLPSTARPCQESDLEELFKMLTGGKEFKDVYELDEALTAKLDKHPSLNIRLKLKLCLTFFEEAFPNLHHKDNMIRLLKHLRNYFHLPEGLCSPLNDWSMIYHECHVLFCFGSRVRFGWLD